jgi:DNA-binding beta-propeller fold protein YncE
MKRIAFATAGFLALLVWHPVSSRAEILALMNYETKSPDSLKTLKNPITPGERSEGIAVMDVDPTSANYGKIVETIPLPNNLVAHHIFYNRALTKAYVTALGQSVMHVIDMSKRPFVLSAVETPGCSVQEDVVFSNDNRSWYLTCMGTQNVVVGDADTDKPVRMIPVPSPYPHGVAIMESIDRMITTSTVRPSDLGDPGETMGIVELSTGKQLGTLKVSKKPSPAGAASVEVLVVPGANPPAAYVTTMFGGELWLMRWNPATKNFDTKQVFDFAAVKSAVPLEIYFNEKRDRLYVTTAKPGNLNIFDISSGLDQPKLLKSIAAAEGAHHVAITADDHYAFVQNALLNLPGMSDGSVTVIDMQKGERIDSIETLKNAGFNPNCIVLLPKWYQAMGH